ncbi:MAG: hypothetical protein H7Y13_03090 [Sphingobacteriaceae bacterium]|nr:hypothetical protein [Sphingobacteriaceae bacterium]
MEELFRKPTENKSERIIGMNQIDFFFQRPNDFNEKQQAYSILFLLRRDILTSFGINPNDNSKIEFQVLFPGTMAIMAGIDLLSKFYFTDNDTKGNKSGDRFKGYVAKYIDSQNQEILYQLRNSLLHSFGLYSKDRNGKVYNFILDRGNNLIVKKLDDTNYVISVILLLNSFESSIQKYKKDILAEPNLMENFILMLPKYGGIGIKNN